MKPTLSNLDPREAGIGVFWTRCVSCGRPAALAPEQNRCPRCTIGGTRCPAAHPDEPSGCDGPADAVRVVDHTGDTVLGRVRHAAILLASVTGARVHPATVDGAALRAHRLAATLTRLTFTATRRWS